jgi:hypothetical protein
MGLFNNTPRRKHSHGHRMYNKHIIHYVSFTPFTLREYAIGSEWIKSIRKLLKSRVHHLLGKMRTIYPSVFKRNHNPKGKMKAKR